MVSIYSITDNTKNFAAKPQSAKPKEKCSIQLFDFKKCMEKYEAIVPKFYTVDFDSIIGRMYVKDYSNTEININGNIDGVRQVKNDCWLLAGILALANTPKGEEYLRKTLVKTNNNTVVSFKGINTDVIIPKIVLAAAKQSKSYVKGDDNILALEVATEYYKKMLIQNNESMRNKSPNLINGKYSSCNLNDPLGGGFSSDILYLITGKKSTTIFNLQDGCSKEIKNLINKIQNNPNKYALTCNFKQRLNGLYINHAYAIKEIDENFVTLINPHNSKKEEKIPLEDFYGNVKSITFLDLKNS